MIIHYLYRAIIQNLACKAATYLRPRRTMPRKRGLSRSGLQSKDPERGTRNPQPGTLFSCNSVMLCLCVLVAGGLTACGYHFAGQGSPFPSDIKTIAIPIFENQTAETGFESLLTNQLVYQFSSRGRLGVVGPEKADLVLKGRVRSADTRDVAFTGGYLGIQRRVMVTLSATLITRDGRKLWEDQNITEEEVYRIESNPVVTEARKREILDKIARDVAEIIYVRVFEDF